MLLTESMTNELNESFSSYPVKIMPKDVLTEWVEAKDDFRAPEIAQEDIDVMCQMAQLQEQYLAETNFTSNIATFTNKIQPLLRRVAPQLMAFDVIGVQPVTSPSSSIFMIKAQYSGTSALPADVTKSIIMEFVQPDPANTIAVGDTFTSANGATGTVVYVNEGATKAIVNVTAGTFAAGDKFDVGASYSADSNDMTVSAIYSNEASFKQILPGYSGPYSTTDGEALGADMRQLRVRIVDQSVTLKTRKLKAELTLELIQDMKAMHGLAADKEIMNFLEREIVLDMNQEIIDELKKIATVAPNIAVATTTDTQGRHAMEMYSGMYDTILNEKRKLAKKNGQGPGNVLIASSSVLTGLQRLGVFNAVNVNMTKIKRGPNHSANFAGTLEDGTKVYEDWFATSDYALVLYNGTQAGDNALIYSPYQPIMFLEAKSAIDFQPVLGVQTRYSLTRNTLKDNEVASTYCTYIGVDFVNTPLK